jgi:thiol-disulfide isomerase/thioredoxin
MQFLNHYSALMLAGLLTAAGISLAVRSGGQRRHWLILGVALLVLVGSWSVLRPVARPLEQPTGRPLLLELQSPYCLGCLAIKSQVDRLEKELAGTLKISRLDIQSPEGRRLVRQYGVEITPTFIFLDAGGREKWRSVGQLDAVQLRSSLPQSGTRPRSRLALP